MMVLFGITSCDTCKRAYKALVAAGYEPTFRDIRVSPLSAAERHSLLEAFGDALLNRASTTWRSLDSVTRELGTDALLASYPTLMKRPVIEGKGLTLGWSDAVQALYLK
jgi:arsenate reductase